MRETWKARPGVETTETGRSEATAGTKGTAQNDYNRSVCGFQGRLALRPGELAEVLGIGRNAAYALCNRADFPTIHVGRKLVIPVDGLRRWLDQQTEVAT